MNGRLLTALTHLLLGPDGHSRVRTSQTLLSLGVFAVFSLVQHGEVMAGMVPYGQAMALTAYNLGQAFGFYLLIRTGVSARFNDPALTMPQCVCAMIGIVWSYAIAGPVRGVVICTLLLVIFFGMFALAPRQASRLGAFGLGLLSVAMLWRGLTDPLRYDPLVEVVHFLYAAIVIAAVSVLSIRLGRLRSRLSQQKKELQEALARIQTLATRDALTGLLNRRAMMDTMLQECQRAERAGSPLSLALIDLDHFKQINDSHGHKTGDRVLCAFAAAARESLRGTDAVARWGGEEFMLMMPATGLTAALTCIERVRLKMAATHFENLGPDLSVTFSAGITQCDGEADLEPAIERADQAMYQAKSAGRNCSRWAQPLSVADPAEPSPGVARDNEAPVQAAA